MTLFRNKGSKENSKKRVIRTCCIGEVFDLSLAANKAISSKILGEGFGVSCAAEEISAPVNGTVVDISDNGHTYTLSSEDELVVLVCINADNSGEVIEPLVTVGQKVSAGDVLCSKEDAEAAVVVRDSDRLSSFKIAMGKAKSITDGVIIYEL